MKKNTLFAYVALGVVVMVLLVLFTQKANNGGLNLNQEELNQEKISQDNVNDKVGNQSYLEGVLHLSDNQALGNLKLISESGVIYIKTERDFSRLVGVEVIISINGTLDNFELVDIQSKVAGDEGYLISN